MASSNRICTPRCSSDWECSAKQKCCPNIRGTKSCVNAGSVNTGGGTGKG